MKPNHIFFNKLNCNNNKKIWFGPPKLADPTLVDQANPVRFAWLAAAPKGAAAAAALYSLLIPVILKFKVIALQRVTLLKLKQWLRHDSQLL